MQDRNGTDRDHMHVYGHCCVDGDGGNVGDGNSEEVVVLTIGE